MGEALVNKRTLDLFEKPSATLGIKNLNDYQQFLLNSVLLDKLNFG